MRSPDPKKLAESLGTLMEAASDFGLELSDKEYLGHTITYLEIELPEELGAEGVTMPTPAFTTTGSHAFFTDHRHRAPRAGAPHHRQGGPAAERYRGLSAGDEGASPG